MSVSYYILVGYVLYFFMLNGFYNVFSGNGGFPFASTIFSIEIYSFVNFADLPFGGEKRI